MPEVSIRPFLQSLLTIAAVMPLQSAPTLAAEEASPLSATQCIADVSTDYREEGRKFTFTMNFQNECDRPIACVVDAYLVSSRGPSQGHTTLKFPPKSQVPAKLSYTMQVKAIGGSAQYSRDCRFLSPHDGSSRVQR